MTIRKCFICRQKNDRSKLTRLIFDKNKNEVIEDNRLTKCRGIYYCPNHKIDEKTLKIAKRNLKVTDGKNR
ncbi:YlxR family protein [Spiroplasma endosymbiont of Anurida maritima]|uniref:DUF448 domain-containing protein n=1 Tax=Spiroplasma endosymbiont of Anurida maritima TaxID=2967972 RepID=UPI0036D3D067